MQLIELRLVQLLLKLQLPPQRSLERLLRLYCNPLKKSLAPYIAWFKVLVESDSASGCSEGKRIMDNFLASDDLHYMIGVLRTLGLHVEEDKALKRAIVEGYGGQFPVGKESKYKKQLFLGNAGTAMRPIIAWGGGGYSRMLAMKIHTIQYFLEVLGQFVGTSNARWLDFARE